jgi:hypothetical protein
MNEHLTIAQLVEVMRTERSNWEALLAEVGEARLAERGVEGDWSIKDIVAHLTFYERWATDCLEALQLGEPLPVSEFKGLSMDERNALIYARNQTRPLADVLADATVSFQRSIDVVQRLRDEDLYNPDYTHAYGVDWTVHDLIEGDAYEHYQDHIASVRAWLDRVPATPQST